MNVHRGSIINRGDIVGYTHDGSVTPIRLGPRSSDPIGVALTESLGGTRIQIALGAAQHRVNIQSLDYDDVKLLVKFIGVAKLLGASPEDEASLELIRKSLLREIGDTK